MNRPEQIPARKAGSDLRPETPEETDINKDIKGREVEDVWIQINSFNISLKLFLIPNATKGGMRKVKETILLTYHILRLFKNIFY